MCSAISFGHALVLSIALASNCAPTQAQQPTVELRFVESLVDPNLHGINRMVISNDGRFLYGAAWLYSSGTCRTEPLSFNKWSRTDRVGSMESLVSVRYESTKIVLACTLWRDVIMETMRFQFSSEHRTAL